MASGHAPFENRKPFLPALRGGASWWCGVKKTEKEFCVDRHRILLSRLEAHDIDAFLITKIENVRYLSGFGG
ncbi:MAG: aminopeptidase P family N-terminal domain-containing protein, partial [Nitrospirota bacterium]